MSENSHPTLKKKIFKHDIIANEQSFLVTVVIYDSEKLGRSIFEEMKGIYFAEKPTHQGVIALLYPHFY